MAARDVPEPWAKALVKAGLVDPRYSDDRPSMSRLAEEVQVHPSTIAALMYGDRKRTRPGLVTAVADALGVDARTVSKWVGQARSERDPFKPHPDADLLDQDERNAVNELIRVMVRVKKATSVAPADVTPITRTPRKGAGGLAGRKADENMQVPAKAARNDPPPPKDD